MALYFYQIALDARADVGIRRGGRSALVLAILLTEFMRGGDEKLRKFLFDYRLGALFVHRVAVRMQEQNGDGLHAFFHCVADHGTNLLLVERDQHRALGIDSLHDLEAQISVDQRCMLVEEQIVGFRSVDATDLVDVAKALRGQERTARAASF